MMAVTERNVLTVKILIKNRQITYEDIQQIQQIGSRSVHDFLHKHLRARRVVSRQMSHNHTDSQKHTRVEWCRDMVVKCEVSSSRRIYDIITGDKSSKTKRHLTIWMFQNEPTPTKIKRSRRVGNILIARFFTLLGYEVSIPLQNQIT